MGCKFNKELLYSYDDNTIEPLERIFVEEHIRYCPDCQNDLKLIKLVNESINDELFNFDFPDKLSIISELVADNCISKLKDINSRMTINDFIETYKNISNVITESSSAYKNNPYNNFINNSIDTTFNYIKRPMKAIVKNKINNLNIFKKLKIG